MSGHAIRKRTDLWNAVRFLVAAGACAFFAGPPSRSIAEEEPGASAAREAAGGSKAEKVNTPEAAWKAFLDHLESLGKLDAIPQTWREVTGEDGKIALPEELRRGDPVLGALLRVSGDMLDLHALFTDEGKRGVKPEERLERARRLAARLKASEDPYLRDYGRLFEARLALEDGKVSGARPILEELLSSPYCFFARAQIRRALAGAYLQLGEKTHALLEYRFLLLELPPEAESARVEVEEAIRAIRESRHPGPLHECAERTGEIADALRKAEPQGPEAQRDVEAILTKVADLLEEEASRCPTCRRKLDASGRCRSACKKCGACTAGKAAGGGQRGSSSGEKGATGARPGREGAQGSAGGERCELCGRSLGPNGRPQGSHAGEHAAEDTEIHRAKAREARLRETVDEDAEFWGRINDREVERSLRKLWGKIPPAYRKLVAGYFRDITGLEPAPKSNR